MSWEIIGLGFILFAVLGPLIVVLFLGITNEDDET